MGGGAPGVCLTSLLQGRFQPSMLTGRQRYRRQAVRFDFGRPTSWSEQSSPHPHETGHDQTYRLEHDQTYRWCARPLRSKMARVSWSPRIKCRLIPSARDMPEALRLQLWWRRQDLQVNFYLIGATPSFSLSFDSAPHPPTACQSLALRRRSRDGTTNRPRPTAERRQQCLISACCRPPPHHSR